MGGDLVLQELPKVRDVPKRSRPSAGSSGSSAEIMRVLIEVTHAIGNLLPPRTEIVLHDLRRLPNSIVAIHGDLTGRRVGGPPTDLLLKQLRRSDLPDTRQYQSVLPNGNRLKSSTTVIRDEEGTPLAALCVNSDITALLAVKCILDSLTDVSASVVDESVDETEDEQFAHDVDELAAQMLSRSIAGVGIPVHLMKKEHKKEIVKNLLDGGFFALRGSVETAANALGVSRFTIYNYLRELGGLQKTEAAD